VIRSGERGVDRPGAALPCSFRLAYASRPRGARRWSVRRLIDGIAASVPVRKLLFVRRSGIRGRIGGTGRITRRVELAESMRIVQLKRPTRSRLDDGVARARDRFEYVLSGRAAGAIPFLLVRSCGRARSFNSTRQMTKTSCLLVYCLARRRSPGQQGSRPACVGAYRLDWRTYDDARYRDARAAPADHKAVIAS